jgi:long-chain acyl-CoA synthetase
VAADTIPARLFRRAEETPGRPAFFEKANGEYRPTSWSGYADAVRRAGKSLIALGFQPGQHVAILGFNRPEWVILDVACMSVGGAPAGIYTTSSPDEIAYVAGHCEAPVVLVENEGHLAGIRAIRDRLPALQRIVTMRGVAPGDDPGIVTWEQFLAEGDGVDDQLFLDRLEALEEHALATLIYTSGTTGPPKGVMLTHHNLVWTTDAAGLLAPITSDERLLSYLPLSHIAEQAFTIHGAITHGYAVYYAESIERLADNLKEVRPTLFFGVPRVWEKFHAGVAAKLSEASGVKARIGGWAQRVGRRVADVRNDGGEPRGLLKVQYGLADRLVFSKVKSALGMDDCHFAVSGAAPISREIVEFFAGFDLQIYEVYGQSEGTGPTTFNREGRTRFGTVGPPFPGAEVRIAEDGEVMLRGGNVFAGYYKNPEATAETLRDGWLYSGDLGEFDRDGYLVITGRKKDIIVTAGGKNVAPANLESVIKDHFLVSEAVVIGDGRRYLTALVTIDPDSGAAFAASNGVEGPLYEFEVIRAEIGRHIDEVNQTVSRVAQVKRFEILPRELSVEEGELTGTLKVKRAVVMHHFADFIEAMYAE